jgi:two-component system sensor kinase FixL
MASVLAHELNQPLTAATSAIRAAQRMLPLTFSATGLQRPADIHEAMDLAIEQALRAGQIVRRLRDFVSWGDVDKRLEEPRKLVEEAGTLALTGATERGIQVEHRIESGLPSVIVDRIQIQQVLFNLIRNAVDAMATAADKGADACARCRKLIVSVKSTDAETVEIAVADTGPGLALGVVDRLFDSFVSTKPGGMGMGLSICRSIVEAHGGRIWTEPNPGGGTLFRFTLPAAPLSDAESC